MDQKMKEKVLKVMEFIGESQSIKESVIQLAFAIIDKKATSEEALTKEKLTEKNIISLANESAEIANKLMKELTEIVAQTYLENLSAEEIDAILKFQEITKTKGEILGNAVALKANSYLENKAKEFGLEINNPPNQPSPETEENDEGKEESDENEFWDDSEKK